MVMTSPDPSKDGFAVSPSNTVDFEKQIRALYVNATGTTVSNLFGYV